VKAAANWGPKDRMGLLKILPNHLIHPTLRNRLNLRKNR
jgi:hypothetical protein